MTKSIPISCACFYAEILFAPWVVPFQQLGLHSFMLSLKTLKKRSDKVTVRAIPLSSHASFAALTRASAWGLLNSNLPNSSSISSKESRLIRARSLGSRPTAAGPRSRHWSPIHSATSLSQSKRNNIHLFDISQLGHEIRLVMQQDFKSLHGPLNSKVCLNGNLPPLFEARDIKYLTILVFSVRKLQYRPRTQLVRVSVF